MGRVILGVTLATLVGGAVAGRLVVDFQGIGDAIVRLPAPSRPVAVLVWYDAEADRVALSNVKLGGAAIPVARLVLPAEARVEAGHDRVVIGPVRLSAMQAVLAALIDDPPGVCRLAEVQPERPMMTTVASDAIPAAEGGSESGESRFMLRYRSQDDRLKFAAPPPGAGIERLASLEVQAVAVLDEQADALLIAGEPWTATRCVLSALRGGPFGVTVAAAYAAPGPPRPPEVPASGESAGPSAAPDVTSAPAEGRP